MSQTEPGWLLTGIATIGGVLGGGGLWAWLGARTKAPADLTASQAAFQTALSLQAEAFIKTLQSHNDALAKRIDEMQGRIESLEQENYQCRGENAQLHQMIESLEAELRRAGVNLPPRRPARSFTVIEEGVTTVLTPTAAPPEQPTKPARRRRTKL